MRLLQSNKSARIGTSNAQQRPKIIHNSKSRTTLNSRSKTRIYKISHQTPHSKINFSGK